MREKTKLAIRTSVLALGAAASFLISGCGGGSGGGLGSAHAWILDSSNHIRRIRLDNGVIETAPITITGLQAAETILAIDARPSTEELYGIGSTGRVYKISVISGAATLIGSPVTLTGSAFDIDFNPTVDRIRLVSDADQSIRINPDTAVPITDTNLAYDAADTHSGADPNVVAVAYTNNFVGSTGTTLFGLDATQNTLVRIGGPNSTPSPNGGVITTIASLGVDFTTQSSMDVDNEDAFAYATLALSGNTESSLFTIDLATGQAFLVSTIGTGQETRDIAVIP